jgi:uncharacterized protein (DUF2345 family)
MIDRVNKYTGVSKRSADSVVDRSAPSNPCIAVVTNHLDSQYMGALEVQIQNKSSSGSTRRDGATSYIARYLSPFAGVTPIDGVQANAGHEFTQKSYGMWFIPPDIGSRVLVIFAEGGEVFWIGCIPEKDVNFQMPAGDAVTTYHKDVDSAGQKLPVSEINKKNLSDADRGKIDATEIQKEVNTDYAESLVTRGLASDETRGLTTSSARRETPSKVFGISTPGPYDRRNAEAIVSYGAGQIYHNRLGGSSLVMDDGDESLFRKGSASTAPSEYADRKQNEDDGDVTIPHNEMLRLKTRTGHQILMHNSEDLIYIGNSRGTAWIELTSNGKIDIYSEDSISVRTAQDLNFKADRDINFQADRDFNVKAKKNITMEAQDEDFQLIVGRNNQITTEGFLHVYTDKDVRLESNTSFIDLLAEKSLFLESAAESTNILSKKNNSFTATDGDTSILSGQYYLASTGKTYHMNDENAQPRTATSAISATQAVALTTWTVSQGETETIMRRVPSREPWLSHENLAPLNFAPKETDIKKPNEDAPSSVTSVPPVEGEYKLTADTFRKGA